MRGVRAKRLRRSVATMEKSSRPRADRRRDLREKLHPYTIAHDRNRRKAAASQKWKHALAKYDEFRAFAAVHTALAMARGKVGL